MQALDKKKTLLYLFHIKYIQIFFIWTRKKRNNFCPIWFYFNSLFNYWS